MTSKKIIEAPKLPHTPSRTINEMLQSKCGHTFDHPVKAAVAYYMAYVFQAITYIYNTINPNKSAPSHTKWMAACGAVSALIVIKAYLGYHLMLASAFFLYHILYYASIGVALIGIGIGVSGAMFFDKEGDKPRGSGMGVVYQRTQEFQRTETSTVRTGGSSAAHTGPTEASKED